MSDEDALAELDRNAVSILTGHRPEVALEPRLDELVVLDFRQHPWARLVVGAALNDLRDDRCSEFVQASLVEFQQQQNDPGIGHAYSLLGYIALGRGQLAEATHWLRLSREHLQEDSPASAVNLAHIGLGAYQQGQLQEAIGLTQEGLALARVQGSRRQEGVACLYLAFFGLITGDFNRVETLLEVAEQTYLELADEVERFEYPLVLAGRAVLHALRGQTDLAEHDFEAARATAETIKVPWYVAIVLVLRAEFTAALYPARSVADARNAMEMLVALNDAWWQTWALRAQGVAAREAGDIETSVHVLRRLLQKELNPLERGLTLLALGETLLRTDGPRDAVSDLVGARDLLDGVGATYWVARCLIALSEADPSKRDLRRQAAALSHDDPAYRRILHHTTDLRITVLGEAGVWRGTKRLTFATRNAELVVYCLALAGPAGLHDEILIDRLWPDAPRDRGRGRLRTELWHVRLTLANEANRLERRGRSVHLRTDGVFLDLQAARERASAILKAEAAEPIDVEEVVGLLSRPVLADWQYEPWVSDEVATNDALLAALRRWQARR